MSERSDMPETRYCWACGDELIFPPLPERTRRGNIISERIRKLKPPKRMVCSRCYARIARAEHDTAEAARLAQGGGWTADDVANNPSGALRVAGVPPRLVGATLDAAPDFQVGVLDALRQWAGRPHGALTLLGPPGAGKSYLAIGVLREAMLAAGLTPGNARFLHERDFLQGLRQSYAADAAPVPDRLLPDNDPAKVRLLVLDDLAAAGLTPWGRGELCGLIDARYSHSRAMILTSNLTVEELAGALDARVASRLAEGVVTILPDRDLRMTGCLHAEANDPDPTGREAGEDAQRAIQ